MNSPTSSAGATREPLASATQRRAAWGVELESLLSSLLSEHEAWLGEVRAHRDAVRRADGAGVQEKSQRQARLLERIAGLEEKRAGLINRVAASADFQVAEASGGRAKGPLTLRGIAEMLDEPQRSRLLAWAQRLRALIEQVQTENRTVRAAATSLMAHMEGLMRQVARRLSHAGTYGSRGIVEACPGVATAVDLTR